MKGLMVRGAVAAMVCGAFAFAAEAKPTKLVPVTVSGYSGTTELTNFPVLVRISSSTISGFSYSDCKGDGGSDLSFVDADGAALAHEIDTWNEDGESTVWVKIPVLTNNVSFVMRWSDANPASATASAAWNEDYVMVFHMGEESGTCANSTSHGSKYDATPMGATADSVLYSGSDAPVGGARTTAKSANDKGYLSIPSYTDENVGDCFAISGWMYAPASFNEYPRIVSRKKGNTDTGGGFTFAIDDKTAAKKVWVRGNGSDILWVTDFPSTVKNWVHWAVVFEGSTCRIYGNGALMTTYVGSGAWGASIGEESNAIGAAVDNGLPLSLGCNSAGADGCFVGAFDEFRLKKGVASADWVKAEYDTVKSAAFVSFGEVVTRRGMLIILR